MSDLIRKIQDMGILADQIHFDGEVYRYATRDKPHSKNAYVIGWEDGRGAWVGDWSSDSVGEYVSANGDHGPLSQETRRKIDEAKAKAQAQRQAQHTTAALEAQREYEAATPCTIHPYLEKKQVSPVDGLRIQGRDLIIPAYGLDGKLQTIQRITPDGGKIWFTGASAKAVYFQVKGPKNGAIMVGEGLATVLSAVQATGFPAFVAFNTGGLLHIAKMVREWFPDEKIILLGDNDQKPTGENPGKEYATKAAQAVGGVMAMPDELGDWNDVHCKKSIQDVEKGILGAKDLPVNKFAAKIIHPGNLHAAFLKTLGQGWTVKGVLPESAMLNVTYGPPSSFKSFFEVDMALCISTGKKWHGREVKKRPVCYIAAEGQAGMLKRIEAWKKHHGIQDIGEFYLLPMPAILDDENDRTQLIQLLKMLPVIPQYIVFDTLARSMQGDENKTPDMNQIVRCCGEIIDEISAQIKIVHHTGKDVGRGSRGSIALPGATETIHFAKVEDKEARQVAYVCDRQKDEEEGKPLVFNLLVIDTGFVNIDGDPVTSLVPVFDLDATATYLEDSKRKATDTLRGAAKAVWDAFLEAWEQHAEQPGQEIRNAMSTDPIAMGNNKVVHEDKWRGCAYQRPDLSKGQTQSARQNAFIRGRDSLLGIKKIAGCHGYFWKA